MVGGLDFGELGDVLECAGAGHNGAGIVNRWDKKIDDALVFVQVQQTGFDDFLVTRDSERAEHDEKRHGLAHIGNGHDDVVVAVFGGGCNQVDAQ